MANYWHDLDIYGREQANGQPFEVFNSEAIKNAFVLWASSKAGDFLMNPEAGGVLDRLLFKNLDGKSIGVVMFSLKNALFKEFAPAITIVDLKIDKDYTTRTVKISITYKEIATNNINVAEILTKDLKPLEEQTEQNVAYTGVNLKMFCTIKKPDMDNELLKYIDEEGVWRWGIYAFTNFSTEDTYYSEILEICNS